ncbi:MAG: extracellular solute-binding protein, partial [Alphaproteobacteria bacterium]|nr:extracellular solute-binding protein [Alphaproteobacteria bacterium]
TTLETPVSSGPYIIRSVNAGKSITYARDPDYWGRDLMVNRGHNNFDSIRYDYYRDSTVAVQALRAGAFDLRVENEAKKWAHSYGGDISPLEKVEFPHGRPSGMQGFVFNTRLPIFSDPRVRRALGYALDFEWTNRTLFSDSYIRANSYFSNSYMAATGKPAGKELRLLERHRAALPPEAFGPAYVAPVTDGSGYPRENLIKALALLEEAGWTVGADRVLRDQNGQAMEFEILLDMGMGAAWERITLPFIRNLRKLGVNARVRTLDPIIYRQRIDNHNFAMTAFLWPMSLAPGPELNVFFGSAAADIPNTFNVAGIRSAAVDDLIRHVISAETFDDLVAATRALDRALTFGHYVIPHWYLPLTRMVVDTQKLAWPDRTPLQGTDLNIWWAR